MRAFAFGLSAVLLACGGEAAVGPAGRAPVEARAPKPSASTKAASTPVPSNGLLQRKDVKAYLDAGFAAFLRTVVVEPRLVDGQFRGWTIVELRPAAFWAGVDLKPGDVVLSVNDLPIERETEAYDAFESLRNADRLAVAVERGGEPRILQYRIVSSDGAASGTAPGR